MRSRTAWLLVDVVAVVVFAAIGRTSHAEDLTGTLVTAAPFLVGALVGGAGARSWRAPLSWRAGLATWAGAVVIGLVLRALFLDRLPLSFAIVVTLSLGVLLLGWRGVARLVFAMRIVRRRSGGGGPTR